MDQLSKLGIKIGSGSLVDMKKSEFDVEKLSHDVVRKGSTTSPRERLEEQLTKGGVGIPVTTVLNIPVDRISAERTKMPNEKSKKDYLKDTSGESFHSDNDKEVQEEQESEEEIRLSLSPVDLWSKAFLGTDSTAQYLDKSMAPKKEPAALYKKSELKEKIEERPQGVKKKEFEKIANLHENSEGVVEKKVCKSELEEAFDWIAKSDKFDFNKDGKLDAHEKAHKDEKKTFDKFDKEVKELKEEEKEEHKKPVKKGNFIKSIGPGGILFDFGAKTGNPLADNATALLNSFADKTQEAITRDQSKGFAKSIEEYVAMGDRAYAMKQNSGQSDNYFDPHGRMDKSLDQQVKEAYERGEFDNTTQIKSQYNVTKASVGGEVISATSETDAALIEMMKAELEAQNDPTAVDLKQSVIAGID